MNPEPHRAVKETKNHTLLNESNVIDEPEPSTTVLLITKAQRINPRMRVALGVIVLAVLISVVIIGDGGKSPAVDDIKKQLGFLNDQAARQEKQELDDFDQRLKALAAQNRALCDAGIASAVNTLVRHDQIGWLIADFAQDKVLGGHRSSDRVGSCTTGLTEPMKNSTARTVELLDTLALKLTAVNNRYALSVGEVIESHHAELPKADFEHLAALPHGVAQKVSTQVATVAVAVALEGLTIRATQEVAANLLKLLASKLGPQITKAVTGVAAAAADGPLPIGDILTVGFALLVVWDVISLPDNIRSSVRGHFEDAVNKHLATLGAQVKRTIEELAKQRREARDELSRQVQASLQ